MKNIFLILNLLFSTFSIFAQIIDIDSGITVIDAPSGAYVKDINNTFTPFLGTWKYQNGNEILIIKLEKVSQYYYPEYGNYEDFIKGNYSYTLDNGFTYIIDTISENLSNNNPNDNPMYSSGPSSNSQDTFSFYDVLYNKPNCTAKFTFISGSSTQLKMELINNFQGYISPDSPTNPNFSIPNNIILIKQ